LATIAHPTASEFGKPTSSMRAALERAVDDAPSHIRPPRGRLRRLFARDRSARTLVERYRLWPAIEHAIQCVTDEYGPVRVGVAVEDDGDDACVVLELFCDAQKNVELYEFESAVRRESRDLLDDRRRRRLRLFINPPFPRSARTYV
jgi:hypothetical protein